jgi:peptide deformylase
MTDRIVIYPEAILRQKAQPVKRIDGETLSLLERMTELLARDNGVGLAANQAGEAQRVIVLETEEGPVGLVNPKIEKAEAEQVGPEGCLSLPGLYGLVRRSARVTVRGLDSSGKRRRITGEGLLARAIEHEIDHLNGVLFVDRAEPDSLYWLVRDENGESYQQPTTLEQALKVFELRSLASV